MKDKKSPLIYAIALSFLVAAVIFLKAYTYQDSSLVVYGYTFFVTTFMLSRVMGSFFYIPYTERLLKNHSEELKHYRPMVTFIIPSKNEGKAIYNTITKCLNCDYPEDRIEVIAINDGSTDNTLSEMLRAKNDNPGRKVFVENFKQNKGKRQGMIYGFNNSKGEIVIQLDSDSYPERDSLIKLVEPFFDKRVGAAVGHTEPSNKNENLMTKMQTAYYFMSFRALKATESIFDMVFCCSGCYSAYRREYVMPVLDDWVNEKFLGQEMVFGDDRALTNWIIRKGHKTIYIDDAQAYTVVPNTLRKFLKQQVRWKKGWFINSIRICPYVVKKDKFVAFTYFIPLIFVTLLTPIIAFKALVINPAFFGISPFYYVVGVLIVSSILFIHYKVYSGDEYGKYMIAYSILNMTVLSYVMIYAMYDLKNMKWGTR